jgi:hypothetical protein
MRRYFIGIAILAACASLLAIGLHGFPLWLRMVGYFFGALYLVGGSAYFTIQIAKGRSLRGPQLDLFPRSWQRWILDEPDTASQKQNKPGSP